MDPFDSGFSSQFDRQVFYGNSVVTGANWLTWTKPKGKGMCCIVLQGCGGPGGNGVVGANSTAAGGGGGGGGALTVLEIPLALLPHRLYLSLGSGSAASIPSYIAVQPTTGANSVIAIAGGGGAGGNASGVTPGTAGSGGAVATAATMCLGWPFTMTVLAGQAGIAGSATTVGAALTLPTTGLRATGGTGGGGLPAAGNAGTAGGSFTTPGGVSIFPAHAGGAAPGTGTTAPGNGIAGYPIIGAGQYFYGGTGGASTHGSASGAGLVQSNGGNGGIGSGGGGTGGALTGSTAGTPGRGGTAMAIITCY